MLGRLFENQAQRDHRETAELYDRVRAKFDASALSTEEAAERLAVIIVDNVREAHPVPLHIARVMYGVALAFIEADQLCALPAFDRTKPLGMQDEHRLRQQLDRFERFLGGGDDNFDTWCWGIGHACKRFAERLPAHLREIDDDEEEKDRTLALEVDALAAMEDPVGWVDEAFHALFYEEISALGMYRPAQASAEINIERASGRDSPNSTKPYLTPTEYAARHRSATAKEIAEIYLRGTPFLDLARVQIPFSLPQDARFTHTHVLGGSGHGKTQALQRFQLADLERVKEGEASLVVIDSQGDMLETITHLAEFDPDHPESLADRLILIDPNDVEHPPCLNLFDVGLDRLDGYSAVEREKLINGAIALYEYMFGALLGASLTQRQGVIFRYLARLLMVVPEATIHTLRHFMEQPEATRAHLADLDGSARAFFETQFLQPSFDDTRQQILTRLWGVLSNPVLERMFTNTRNKIDVFAALNGGKVLLINTAKDLLKQDGCEILGRFFISLIVQAIQERAAIPANRRMDSFIYIDEAQDYFSEGDKNLEIMFSQARKYRAGITIANQTLGQFPPRPALLRARLDRDQAGRGHERQGRDHTGQGDALRARAAPLDAQARAAHRVRLPRQEPHRAAAADHRAVRCHGAGAQAVGGGLRAAAGAEPGQALCGRGRHGRHSSDASQAPRGLRAGGVGGVVVATGN